LGTIIIKMRQDPYDNSTFNPSRSNQKFSSPRNRNAYHNQKATAIRQKIAFVNKPLHKNLKILMELLHPLNKTKQVIVHKQYLLGKGFAFGVQTHVENYEGKNQRALYNYIIIPIENDQFKIISI
jgi:hypothetical protein